MLGLSLPDPARSFKHSVGKRQRPDDEENGQHTVLLCAGRRDGSSHLLIVNCIKEYDAILSKTTKDAHLKWCSS